MKMIATTSSVWDREGLFDLDTLLPDQFYATFKRGRHGDPETRLMSAILEDAVSSLSKEPRACNRQQRKAREDALNWINARDEEDWIFSFTNVCETLGYDPDYLRQGLTRWASGIPIRAAQFPRLKKYRSGARNRKLRLRSVI